MICPAPTKQTLSTHWLDRLRSARGFPTADGVDFDNFIATQASVSSALLAANESISSPMSTHTQLGTSTPITVEATIAGSREAQNDVRCTGEEEEAGLGHVLCDLFVMGCEVQRRGKISGNDPKKKKSLRKQRNPRFCGTWSKGAVMDTDCYDDLSGQRMVNNDAQKYGLGLAGITNDSCLNDGREGSKRMDVHLEKPKLWRDNEEEEEDLVGYSKSDVTVIDSSIEGWKVQKYLFRKKNVWKVKEKKRKSSLSGKRKKRSVSAHWGGKYDDDGDDYGEKKRMKKVKKNPSAVKVLDEGARPKIPQDGTPNHMEPTTSGRLGQGQRQFLNDSSRLKKSLKDIASVPSSQVSKPRLSSYGWSQNFKSPCSSVILVKPIININSDPGTKKSNGKSSRSTKNEKCHKQG